MNILIEDIEDSTDAAMADIFNNEFDRDALNAKNERWKQLSSRKRFSISNHPLGIMKRVSEATAFAYTCCFLLLK